MIEKTFWTSDLHRRRGGIVVIAVVVGRLVQVIIIRDSAHE
jgi:hypothetical protein